MHEKYGTDHGHEHPKQRRAHMSNGIQLTIQTVIHLPKSSTWWNIFCCWMPSAFGCRRLERVRGNAVQVGQGDIGATRQCVRMTLLFFQVRITLLIFWGWSPSSKCLGIYTKRKNGVAKCSTLMSVAFECSSFLEIFLKFPRFIFAYPKPNGFVDIRIKMSLLLTMIQFNSIITLLLWMRKQFTVIWMGGFQLYYSE